MTFKPQPGAARGASRRRPAASRLHLLGALALLTQAGCALHYTDRRTGAEHLWGLGHLRMQTNAIPGSAGVALQGVVTSSTVPGLCLALGREHFGLSFGFTRRQQLAVFQSGAGPPLLEPTNAPALRLGGGRGLWGFGHLKMRGVPATQGHHAFVTGKASAGLHAGVGGGDSTFTLGANTRQRIVMEDDAFLTFTATDRSWPRFDYFTMQVTAPAWNTNPNHRGNTPP